MKIIETIKSWYNKVFGDKKNLNYFFIFLSVVLVVILSFLLIKNIKSVHRQTNLSQHNLFPGLFLNNKKPINDVNYIENWMTFHYINKIFNVPEDYLKNKLNITDKKYPNLTISKYAKNNKIDIVVVLAQIKQFLWEYIKQNPLNKK